jgi:lysozyme
MSSNAPPRPSGPAASKTPPKAPALISAAGLIAVPLATQFEGYRGKAYLDPASILTQCYGETEGVDPSRIYSRDECAAKLRARMAKDYAPAILACLPQLDMDHRYVFGALLDASYNAGPGNPAKPKSGGVCNSPMAGRIRVGDWAGACPAFVAPGHVGRLAVHGWYTTAKDRKTGVRRELPGLVNRRKAEARTCATAPAPAPPVVARAPEPTAAPPAAVPAPAVVPAPPEKLSLWQRLWRFVAGHR